MCGMCGYVLWQSLDSSKMKASQSLLSTERLLPELPVFSVQLFVMRNNVCGPVPGPSPQGSRHWLKPWEQAGETEAFKRLPDLNRSCGHETEVPIENCIRAKCQIYLSAPESLISFLNKKPRIWPKGKVEKMYC